MENEQQLKKLEEKIDTMYAAIEKLRKYFLATLIITIAMVVLPIIGLLFALPLLMSTLSGTYGGLL